MRVKFSDMHSGGEVKEAPYDRIFIEAETEDQAITIFYNRFGHNPERVSCTCCGDDYSIETNEDLRQLTGFSRGCYPLKTPIGADGKFQNDHPAIKEKYYYEQGESPPDGFVFDERYAFSEPYQKLEDYLLGDGILVIRAGEIKDAEKVGAVPEQGFVWQG